MPMIAETDRSRAFRVNKLSEWGSVQLPAVLCRYPRAGAKVLTFAMWLQPCLILKSHASSLNWSVRSS